MSVVIDKDMFTEKRVSPVRVLIVDDDRFFQETVKRAVSITLANVEVDVCLTVSDAAGRIDAGSSPYDLAIVDLHLPDGDGLAVIRRLAKRHPDCIILMLTVSGDESAVLQAVRAGARGYVVKGDAMLSVQRSIELALRGMHPISPAVAGCFLRLAGREEPAATAAPALHLTQRETELLRKFADGMSYKQAADVMGISVLTVRTHTTNIYRKLGVRSNLRALAVARKNGLI